MGAGSCPPTGTSPVSTEEIEDLLADARRVQAGASRYTGAVSRVDRRPKHPNYKNLPGSIQWSPETPWGVTEAEYCWMTNEQRAELVDDFVYPDTDQVEEGY